MTQKFAIHQVVNTFKCIVVFLVVMKNVLAVFILKLVVVQPLMGNRKTEQWEYARCYHLLVIRFKTLTLVSLCILNGMKYLCTKKKLLNIIFQIILNCNKISDRRPRFEVPKYGYQNLLHFDSVFMPHGSTDINFAICFRYLFLILLL